MFKLVEAWNRLLDGLMIKDSRKARLKTSVEPSYEEISSTLRSIPDLMFELDEDGRYWDVRVNRPELLIAPSENLIGTTIKQYMPAESANIVMQALEDAKSNGYSHGIHLYLPTPLGERWFEVSIARKEIKDAIKAKPRFIVLSRDIHERKLAYLAAERLAYRDQLTDLPNRYILQSELIDKLRLQFAKGFHCALLFIDLDDFKLVNDRHGHHIGDQLLKAVAKRLSSIVRKEDVLIRWGGDEFVIVIQQLPSKQEEAEQHVASICHHIAEKTSKPYMLKQNEITCHLSIGASVFNHIGDDMESMIELADKAMYKTKQTDKQGFSIYCAENI